jgi:fumarylacetoacetase
MPYPIDDTHDPKLESWVESANDPETDFPIQNLPFCDFMTPDGDSTFGVRVGESLLEIEPLMRVGLLGNDNIDLRRVELQTWGMYAVSDALSLNRARLRGHISRLLTTQNSDAREQIEEARVLWDVESCRVEDPVPWRQDYTDFYASLHHATNVGSMFRPNNPLLPNYKHIPIAYHGRASTIVPSGTPIRRPSGQQAPAEEGGSPTFGACRMLDYELEMGFVVGRGNEMGETIPLAEAEDHIFGLCLVNDWSARDIQKWEYQPLGPFLAKNFATTVSPYIVTMEALAPFRTPAFKRPAGDPRPLPYLFSETNEALGGIDITVEAWLASKQMRDRGLSPIRLSRGSFKDMYWTIAQMLTHHASGGCAMQPGDLLASGTISGPSRDARGCLLELIWDGDPWATPPTVVPGTQRTPIELPTGEKRVFLADGDEVILKAYCEREGFRRIGFGECRGVIEPAKT